MPSHRVAAVEVGTAVEDCVSVAGWDCIVHLRVVASLPLYRPLSISNMVDIVRVVDDVQILQAVAEPTRLAIVRQLASDGEVCACDLTDCCGVSQPTVSHHLKVLREANVVRSERRGTWIYYRLEPRAAARIAALGHLLAAGARREPKRVSAKAAPTRA